MKRFQNSNHILPIELQHFGREGARAASVKLQGLDVREQDGFCASGAARSHRTRRKGDPPRLGKGILAALYNPAAPDVAPRFRPPVLSLFRCESA